MAVALPERWLQATRRSEMFWVDAAGGVCCPEALGTMPSCPSSDLYCQVRGLQGASINDTYCLEMGSCGHEGQPGCNHT